MPSVASEFSKVDWFDRTPLTSIALLDDVFNGLNPLSPQPTTALADEAQWERILDAAEGLSFVVRTKHDFVGPLLQDAVIKLESALLKVYPSISHQSAADFWESALRSHRKRKRCKGASCRVLPKQTAPARRRLYPASF